MTGAIHPGRFTSAQPLKSDRCGRVTFRRRAASMTQVAPLPAARHWRLGPGCQTLMTALSSFKVPSPSNGQGDSLSASGAIASSPGAPMIIQGRVGRPLQIAGGGYSISRASSGSYARPSERGGRRSATRLCPASCASAAPPSGGEKPAALAKSPSTLALNGLPIRSRTCRGPSKPSGSGSTVTRIGRLDGLTNSAGYLRRLMQSMKITPARRIRRWRA